MLIKGAPDVLNHYNDVIMGAIASQIGSLTIVYSTVYSGADQRKHQSSASLAFVWGIHRRSMFPFDDVIMICKLIAPVEKLALSRHTVCALSSYLKEHNALIITTLYTVSRYAFKNTK